jgi:3-oxoacyl-[acyl-carrier-protein] synthase II
LSGEKRPEQAYRPFDARHDGIILGEGAGLIVLEEWEHAKKRGARIYGEITGYGSSSDFTYNPAKSEDFTGKRLAMQRALEDASTEPKEIDLIFANGSGVPHEDIQESQAVQTVFERSMDSLSVSGVKPITGHLIYGSAGVEISAALLSLSQEVVPPLANFQSPAPQCELPFITQSPKAAQNRQLILNSFGFGGQNATIVLRKHS